MHAGVHHPEEHSRAGLKLAIETPASHPLSSRLLRIVPRLSRRPSPCSGLEGSGPDHIMTTRFPAAGPDRPGIPFLPGPVFAPPAEWRPAAAAGACTRQGALRRSAGLLPEWRLGAERRP